MPQHTLILTVNYNAVSYCACSVYGICSRQSPTLILTYVIYLLQLELAKLAGKSHKDLSPIYVSLAITYFDLKCPADAINCYMEELEIMEEGNYKEVSIRFCFSH